MAKQKRRFFDDINALNLSTGDTPSPQISKKSQKQKKSM